MAKVSGLTGSMTIGANAIVGLRNVTLETTDDTVDVTTLDSSGWKDFFATLRGWTATGTFLYDSTEASGQDAILDNVFSATVPKPSVALVLQHETGTGKAKYTGNAYITNASWDPVADYQGNPVSITVSFQGTGALARGTQT